MLSKSHLRDITVPTEFLIETGLTHLDNVCIFIVILSRQFFLQYRHAMVKRNLSGYYVFVMEIVGALLNEVILTYM